MYTSIPSKLFLPFLCNNIIGEFLSSTGLECEVQDCSLEVQWRPLRVYCKIALCCKKKIIRGLEKLSVSHMHVFLMLLESNSVVIYSSAIVLNSN